ncbi:AMP-binding protein [Blastochloris tepida]|uniref:Long-chain-fatty-acid--CoA ligase n=1 Tax=Blastochloris tepida TaxID=2233851 RepID=A0A348G131_9HYPH|nr:AMP-binding protein [Blastochloris tepida]BBF93264.1 long-chain-fatty-acid--CoA ligase [Blastochloris tepida]
MSLTAPLVVHGRLRPGETALVFGDDRLKWADLDRAVTRLEALITSRVPAGQGVALSLPNSPALVLLVLAACRAGREAQVFDPGWPEATARRVTERLKPAWTVAGLDLDIPFAQVSDALGAPADPPPLAEPSPDLPFYVGFTSGSTGIPKGFRRSQASWIASIAGEAEVFGLDHTGTVLAPGALVHSLFLYAVVRGLHAGAKVVFGPRFSARAALAAIEREDVRVLYAVPTQLLMLIEAAERAGQGPIKRVTRVLSSGAKWPPSETARLKRLFPNAAFAEFYGASELSFVAYADESAPADSVGRPFPGVEVTIRDASGRRLPVGRTGRVYVRSALCFLEYATGEEPALRREGEALSVGDMGFFDAGGFLHLVGRADRMIISSGRNIHPEEIEAVLRRHPDIAEAAVLGVADAKRGTRLQAIIKPAGQPPTAAELMAFARAHLPASKVPRHVAVLAEWPHTASGKTDFAGVARAWQAGACAALA